jgi:hypothetical protein
VPFTPGGGNDIVARILGKQLTEMPGHRPGRRYPGSIRQNLPR